MLTTMPYHAFLFSGAAWFYPLDVMYQPGTIVKCRMLKDIWDIPIGSLVIVTFLPEEAILIILRSGSGFGEKVIHTDHRLASIIVDEKSTILWSNLPFSGV